MAYIEFDGTLDGDEEKSKSTHSAKGFVEFTGELDKESSAVERVGDLGVSLAKGAMKIPEAVVGLYDIATGGRAGKFAEENLGYKPKQWQSDLDKRLTPEQRAANRNVEQADGFIETLQQIGQNPSVVPNKIAESVPSMVAGGVLGRAVSGAAPLLAGAVGEGTIAAGSAAESIRQETKDGRLTLGQTGAAVGTGIGTGVFGMVGGRLANKFGFADVDSMLAGAAGKVTQQSVIKRIVGGGITEGVFEELPQSVQETIWQNAALDKPLLEGVPNAAAMGIATGGVMGGAAAGIRRPGKDTPTAEPAPTVADIASTTNAQEAVAVASAALDAPVAGQDVTADELDQLESAAGMAHVGQTPTAPIPNAEQSLPETIPLPTENLGGVAVSDEQSSANGMLATEAGIPTSTTEPDVWRFGADKITPEPVASNNIVYRNQAEADAAVAAGREQQSAAQRLSIMDEVLGSEAAVSMPTKQLVKAFSSALAAQGFTDTAPTAQEAARDAMLEAEKPDVIPSLPNEMDVESLIPERAKARQDAPVLANDPLGRVKTLIGQGYTLQGKQLAGPTGERVNLNRQELLYVKSNRKGKSDDRNADGTDGGLRNGRTGSAEDSPADSGMAVGNQPAGSEAVAQGDLPGLSDAAVPDAVAAEGDAGANPAADGQRTLDRQAARASRIAELDQQPTKKLREVASKKSNPAWLKNAAADVLQARADSAKQNRSAAARRTQAKLRGIDPDRDSLAAAVAKLGGIDTESAKGRLRLAPEELNIRGFGIKRMFKRGGRSFDEMVEQLAEMGYIDRDENGKADPQDAADKIAEAAGGAEILTPQGIMLRAQEDAAAQREEIGAQDSNDQDAIEDYADAIEAEYGEDIGSTADEVIAAWEADKAQDPDVDFSAGADVEFEAENTPYAGAQLITNEELDAYADQIDAIESAAAGERTEADSRGQAAGRAEGTGTPEPGARSGEADSFSLTGETKDEGTSRIEREMAEIKAQQAEILRRMDEEKAAAEKREIDARQEASADNFELGQDANDAITGQKGLLFSKAPATNTAAFRNWFKDSKVVDQNGEPEILYHGTNGDFNAFSLDKAGSSIDSGFLGTGFYFTERADLAGTYANVGRGNAQNVMPVYVSLQNPYQWGIKTGGVRSEIYGEKNGIPQELREAVFERAGFKYVENVAEPDFSYEKKLSDALRAELIARGHDGVIATFKSGGKEVVAFHPEQIKSATGNSGTFDGSNPDIRRSTSAPTSGQTVADIEDAIAGLRAKWQGFRNIEVVQSVSDLPAELLNRLLPSDFKDSLFDGMGADSNALANLGVTESLGPQGDRLLNIPLSVPGYDNRSYSAELKRRLKVSSIGSELNSNVLESNSGVMKGDGLIDVVGSGSRLGTRSSDGNTSGFERRPDGRPVDSEGSSDVIIGSAILTHLDRLINRPSKFLRVDSRVVTGGNELKIVDGVIKSIPVDMMNVLVSGKTAANVRFHNKPMLGLPSDSLIENISFPIDVPGSHFADEISGLSHDGASQKATNYARKILDRVEGMYDPQDNYVYLIADHISSPERGVWTAAHEISGHAGLRALGDKNIDDAIRFAGKNRYIADLANAISRDRGDESFAVEEALAELQAAIVTNDFGALEDRYGIAVPEASRNGIRGSIGRVLAAVKKWLAGVMGIEVDAVSDTDVRALLDDARKAVETAGVYMTGRMSPALASMSPELAGELQAHMDSIAERGMVQARELLEFVQDRDEPAAQALADWLDAMGDTQLATSSVTRYLEMTGLPMFSQQEERDLIITHNLTASNLMHALRMGGIAVPSLAVTKKDAPLTNFGEITLIGSRNIADPKGYAKTQVYGADIYSPRYPSVEREIHAKAKREFDKKFAPMAEQLGVSLPATDDLERGDQGSIERNLPVMAQFVKEQGMTPEIVMRAGSLDDGRIARLKKFGLGPYLDKTSLFDLTEDAEFVRLAAAETIDAYRSADDERMSKRADRLEKDEDAKYNVARDLAYKIISDAKQRNRPEADKYQTQQAMEKQIADAGLEEQYRQYVADEIEKVTKSERIFNGHTPSGNRKYIPHTLENVVKILKKELRGGESFNYGVGSLRAHFTPQFKTIAQIKKEKGRLATKEQFEQVKKEIDDEFTAVTNAMGENINMDTAVAILEDAPKMGLERAAAQFDIELSGEAKQQAADFLNKLHHLPTEYFEAKILRDVNLSEFSGAVIPKKASQKVRDALKLYGIPTKEYDGEASRAQAVREFAEELDSSKGDIMFSAAPKQTETAAKKYPLAPRSEWYGEGTYRDNGGRLVTVSPDEYISAVKPLTMDEESRENIDLLKQHILDGGTLDPLLIRADGKEDGRHRAYAAKELGIAQVPVIAYGDRFKDAPTTNDIRFSKSPQGSLIPQGAQASGKVKAQGGKATQGKQALPGMGAVNQPAAFAADPTKVAPTWKEPAADKLDTVLYYMQDKHVDTKRVVEKIKETVGTMDDKWNPYDTETLFHGRVKTQLKDFLDGELEPLFVEMDRLGVSQGDLETYLHNRHAQEANEQIARTDPNFADGGSGIMTKDAQAYLKALSPERRAKYETLANHIDMITKGTTDHLVASGLEKQSMIDKWLGAYKHYVPLFREDAEEVMAGVGSGYNVRGSASERRTGSTGKVDNILANIVRARENAIVRAEKNRVSLAVYGLALKAPNPDFWLPINLNKTKDGALDELQKVGLNAIDAQHLMEMPIIRKPNPRTGMMEESVNHAIKYKDFVLYTRIDGEDRFVIFNQHDERAMRMVKSLKNLDTEQIYAVLSPIAKITRYLGAINTQYNPVFGIANLTRDTQDIMLNLQSTPLAGKQSEVLKAQAGFMNAAKSKTRLMDLDNLTGEHAELWRKFQQEGGITGFRDMYSTSMARQDAIMADIRRLQTKNADWTSKKSLMKLAHIAGDALAAYNEAMENVTRLATFKVALDNGMTPRQAALLAKRISVNFNAKGQAASWNGALYMFFNASIQGSMRSFQTLASKSGKAIIAGGVMWGVAQAVLMAMAGLDDDDERFESVKKSNSVIPTFGLIGAKGYISIPMPQSYAPIVNTGRLLTEWALNRGRKPGQYLGRIIENVFDTYFPWGYDGVTALSTYMPSFIDPFAQLAQNRNSFGGTIYNEQRGREDVRPGQTRDRAGAGYIGYGLAWAINRITGGDADVAGKFSPTSDAMDFLVGTVAGGPGREAAKIGAMAKSAITGEELPANRILLLSRFYGNNADQNAVASVFYDHIEELNRHETKLKGMKERKESRDVIEDYKKSNPQVALVGKANDIEKQIRSLNKEKRKLVADGASSEKIKLKDMRILKLMHDLNDAVERVESK